MEIFWISQLTDCSPHPWFLHQQSSVHYLLRAKRQTGILGNKLLNIWWLRSMRGSKTIFIPRGTWTNHELHAVLIKKTPAFVTSFTKYRLCLSLCCNHLCVGSQFYTHKVAIFISVYINGIKMGIWNRFINKTKKVSGPLQCSKPKLTLKFFVMCQPEFAWLRSLQMPWCDCITVTLLYSSTDFVSLHQSCFAL